MCKPRIGDLLAPLAWEQDPSRIVARPACQVLLYATPAARPALGNIILGTAPATSATTHPRSKLWRLGILARSASPASVIWSQPLRGSTTQAASLPGLRARFYSMPPQPPGPRSGTSCSGPPQQPRDDSPEVQALEAQDLGQVRQPRIGDLVATPAWEHDPSSIGANARCQVLLYATPAASPALGNIIVGTAPVTSATPHSRSQLWRPVILARSASPASVIWSQPLRGSTTQAASLPGLRARFCFMQPQLRGQLSGTSSSGPLQ